MTADKIRNRILQLASHFTFTYKGLNAGIDPFSNHEFEMWFGEEIKTVKSIDEVMNDKFFDGMSIAEISGEIEVIDW